MSKISKEGLEQLTIARNALNTMYDTLSKKGVYESVKDEFQFIAGVIDQAQNEWEKV